MFQLITWVFFIFSGRHTLHFEIAVCIKWIIKITEQLWYCLHFNTGIAFLLF